jgi:penicillin G amidase
MLRKALTLGAVLVLALGLAALAAVHHLRTGPQIRSGTLTLEGLDAPVEILYDSMGVPHIFAASIEDLFLAQGYVHATHRLWQMEMFRRVQEGRLSEIFGERTLDTDRFLRTIGMGEAARSGAPLPGSSMHDLLERYATGVNAAITGWRGLLPPEFVLLRLRPEPWTPALAQGIEKLMAWDLSDYQTGLSLAVAREALGDSALVPLLPAYPEWGVTIVGGWPEEDPAPLGPTPSGQATLHSAASHPTLSPGSHSGRPPAPLPPHTHWELLAQATPPEEAEPFLELGSVVRASNSWVVGGERSASGKPLLANDMHLSLDAPNIWFLVGLHAPGLDVVGMSIPGAPGVVAGHSRAVAWGFTNGMVDDSDFFLELVNPDDPDQYLTPDGWAPFETREEVILVKGRAPDTMTVRSTRHGPVITPVESRASAAVGARREVRRGERSAAAAARAAALGRAPQTSDSDLEGGDDPAPERVAGQVLSFQWVAHSPARTFPALLGMARARTAREFVEALRDFDNPHQNVVFADTAGAWGYWLAGRIPLRASGTPPHLPVPGWTGEHDWIGWVPFQEKPHVLAPERGYVATANNAQGRDERARRVSDGNWASPYRAQRISELLEARDLHDAESFLAIQMDAGSAFADRHLPHAVDAFRSGGLEELAGRLEGWDRVAGPGSTEATLFHTWWTGLRLRFRDHYYGGAGGYFPDAVVEAALWGGSREHGGVGGMGGEERVSGESHDGKQSGGAGNNPKGMLSLPPELPREAARLAAHYTDLPWGEAQGLTLDHPLSAVPVVGRLLKFGRSGIPRVGMPNSPNVNPIGGSRPPFRSGYGPSQRHVVDMADPDASGGFILPGGQSGYPANRHSFDQLELWTEGRLWLLPKERSLVEARTVATLRLVPANR